MTLSRLELCLSFQINISGCEKSFVNVCIHRADRHIQFWMICEDLIRGLPLFNQRRNDLVFLMKQEKETKTVYLVDAGDYDLESPYQIIPDFNKWMEKGFEIEDIDGEDVRGVDYGDLYLIKMPKEGVKGLVTIKRAFNLEMSTGELLQKSKNLPTKLLSNITSSKANIIAEKIGMLGLFEIR